MSNNKSPFEKWNRRSSVNRGFKSPLISRASDQGQGQGQGQQSSGSGASDAQKPGNHHTADDEERLQKDCDRLKLEIRDTDEQIQRLKDSGIDESELAEYIHKLHEYNDLKDVAQMIIGNIASIRGVRTRDLYPDYGLELDD